MRKEDFMNIKDIKVTLDLDCGKAVKLAQMAIEIGETAATLERQTAEFAEAVHQVYQKPILKKPEAPKPVIAKLCIEYLKVLPENDIIKALEERMDALERQLKSVCEIDTVRIGKTICDLVNRQSFFR